MFLNYSPKDIRFVIFRHDAESHIFVHQVEISLNY